MSALRSELQELEPNLVRRHRAANQTLQQQLVAETGSHIFNVNAYTIGYTRDIGTFHNVQTGVGANVMAYGIPDAIKPYYGDHPMGFNVYVRIRLKENR